MHHVIKAYGSSGGMYLCIIKLGSKILLVGQIHFAAALYQQKKSAVHRAKEVGRAPLPDRTVWRREKFLLPPEIELRFPDPPPHILVTMSTKGAFTRIPRVDQRG
jgi:hypothetical protein